MGHGRIVQRLSLFLDKELLRQIFSFKIDAMPEHIGANNIADRINAGNGCFQRGIHGDKAIFIYFYRGVFQAEQVTIGADSRRHEQSISLYLLLQPPVLLDGERKRLVAIRHIAYRAIMDRVPLAEDSRKFCLHVAVFPLQELATDHKMDVGTQAAVRMAKLAADIAAADNEQPFWQFLVPQGFPASHIRCSLQPLDGRKKWTGTGSDDNMLCR